MQELKPERWRALGAVNPADLVAARLTLHWAAQPVSALATTLAEARDDDSHTNLEWLDGHGALAGHPIAGEQALRAALRLRDLTLLLLDARLQSAGELPLAGRTTVDALGWLSSNVASLTGKAQAPALAWRDYEMPAHPPGQGAPFLPDAPRFAELAAWYANADALLGSVAAGRQDASPVRCWPHHFDIATLITLGGSGEEAKTIGAGMTPGDADNYPEPYIYVTPWPYPKEGTALPPLAAGAWRRREWTGAILTGSELVAAGDGPAQHELATGFVQQALAACYKLHGQDSEGPTA